jgi:hypothetical protein
MRIRATDGFGTANGVVHPGQVVDLPDYDALSVLSAGKAVALDQADVADAIDRENHRVVRVLSQRMAWARY